MLPGIYATTELTVRPDAFDPHLDVAGLGDPDAEAVPGASQLRTMGFSGTPSQL
ncbi:hypothetical protein Y717_03550 [Streptomyces scopuliridis RB72]|uniref:Uncharacterized protein n=1 Tax=Streptomyces scopuliridis RB72 TaxID=1440053 RepID=A0A2T7TBC0_9ACTN|nr:hypothetical protein Y717_03550 [Streptomyces scopuliridis RB72]